jgi:acyl-CoA thioester hydrolase
MNPHPAFIPPKGRHRYAARVYYEDTDAGGIVYHANYLRFAERARTEALRDLGVPHAALLRNFNLMFVVRRVEVDYLRPARVDDSLVVETEVLAVAGASAFLRQTVQGPEGTCARMEIRLACIAPGGSAESGSVAGRPERIPPQWREALQAMRNARPAATGAAGEDAG